MIAALNAVLPPLVAALRLPFTLALGFVLVLALDAVILLLASDISPNIIHVDSFGWALLAALVISAAIVVLDVILGANDDDTYSLRVIRRIARRQGTRSDDGRAGILFLEIDGLALPVLEAGDARRQRTGAGPLGPGWHASAGRMGDRSELADRSQSGRDPARVERRHPGVSLGRQATGKSDGVLVARRLRDDRARLASGNGLLVHGGASRGNLFSGEADEVILTASRLGAEKRANPGYRAFLANGFNVTRTLVLFIWEVILELVAAVRQKRRDVCPRGDRGGRYPLLRAALCVGVRDLIVFGVLTDMMRGRPVVYATFSSYDEVAHHSGLERADTLEALRKVDQQFGRIARARRFAPRPYELVVLSDHGQTQGATFKQRNGYDLHQFVERSLERAAVTTIGSGEENDVAVRHAMAEATGRSR